MEPDKRFAREHSDKAAKQFMVLMLTKEYRICLMSVNLHGIVPSVELKGELSLLDSHSAFQFDIIRLFHCDGLLLCTSIDKSRIVVSNPLTGETKWIKASKRNKKGPGHTFALGYYYQDKKSCSKSYKILSFRWGNDNKGFEIYEFDSDSWRILDYDISPGWSLTYSRCIVSLKRNSYIFAYDQTITQLFTLSLLKFDFSTEKCRPVTLPSQWQSYFEAVTLSVVREEKLSVLLEREYESKTEIWVTNKITHETNVVSWSKVLVLDLTPDLRGLHDVSFLLDEEKKVVVCCERGYGMEDDTKSYDLLYIVGEDNKATQVTLGVDTMALCWPKILYYVPSLVRI